MRRSASARRWWGGSVPGAVFARQLFAHVHQRAQITKMPIGALDAAHFLEIWLEHLIVTQPGGDFRKAPLDAGIDNSPILGAFFPGAHVLQTPGSGPCSGVARFRSKACEGVSPDKGQLEVCTPGRGNTVSTKASA